VVLRDGALLAHLERGARTLVTFTDDPDWCGALVTLVKDGRLRQIEITHVDGVPVREHPHAEAWRAAGARDTPRGLVVRG
jgi:ATP-dependent Lhr-like helicase